jgi:hypothetical protein
MANGLVQQKMEAALKAMYNSCAEALRNQNYQVRYNRTGGACVYSNRTKNKDDGYIEIDFLDQEGRHVTAEESYNKFIDKMTASAVKVLEAGGVVYNKGKKEGLKEHIKKHISQEKFILQMRIYVDSHEQTVEMGCTFIAIIPLIFLIVKGICEFIDKVIRPEHPMLDANKAIKALKDAMKEVEKKIREEANAKENDKKDAFTQTDINVKDKKDASTQTDQPSSTVNDHCPRYPVLPPRLK